MSNMELCGIDLTFPLMDFRKSLKLLRLLEFKKADITLNADDNNRHLNTYKELEKPYENGRRLLGIMREEGLKQTDLFMFMGDNMGTALNSPDKAVRDMSSSTFKSAVEYAKACECSHITILPGMYFDEQSMIMASKELRWRAEMAGDKGITLGVEPHIGSIIDTPIKAAELVEITPGLTLTLDYSHFIKNGVKQSSIDKLICNAAHMHFRNASRKSSQTIFSESEIDYIDLIKKIKKSEFSGEIAIEFCSSAWEDQNRIDTISETIRLKEYIENNWNN